MSGPSQPKTTDEVWSDERIKSFLDAPATEGISHDFHILYKAYKGMRIEDFTRFVPFFVEAGKDINAKNQYDQTLLAITENQEKNSAYSDVLKQAGAQ